MWLESEKIHWIKREREIMAIWVCLIWGFQGERADSYLLCATEVCVCVWERERVNGCFIMSYYSAVSSAGPPKVMLGAGMKAISSLALTKCEPEKCLESPPLSKNATLPHNWLACPDFIILCERTSCLCNYTHHLWVKLSSRGFLRKWNLIKDESGGQSTVECSTYRQVCYLWLHLSEVAWKPESTFRCRWIPISQLCTIDFVLMCKCNGLQANPIMES